MDIIATSLFQNNICILPGIGTFTIVTQPAETDFINTRIKAPKPTIVFSPGQESGRFFNEFSAVSELLKKELEEKGGVVLDGIGTLTKNENGSLRFSALPLPQKFNQPVAAERVIRQDSKHAMLVGDKQTDSVIMTEYFSETEKIKDRWWIWAAVIAAASIIMCVVYFSQQGPDNTLFGNGHVLEPASAGATYKVSK